MRCPRCGREQTVDSYVRQISGRHWRIFLCTVCKAEFDLEPLDADFAD